MSRSHAREFVQRDAPVLQVEDKARTAIVAISSEHPDRHNSVISQRGLRYGQNLPVLVGHDAGELPVARASRIWLAADRDGVNTTYAKLQFPKEGEVAAADEAYNAMRHGLADSLSIGFWVDQVSERSDGLLQIDAAELAEISLVSVPANSRARVIEVNRAPGFDTRVTPRPSVPMRVIHHPAPMINAGTTGLDKVTLTDFAALALPKEHRDDRDLGPAEEWHQELVRMAGKAPSKGVLRPIGLRFADARDLAKRALTPLTTEELLRQLLDYYVAAMRAQAIFGPLGVTMLSPAEAQIRIPSVATPGADSAWIGKDTAAAPTAIPTFADVTGRPHTLSTLRIVPRSLLLYTTGVAQDIIRQDMAGAHIAAMQAYLFGDPVADEFAERTAEDASRRCHAGRSARHGPRRLAGVHPGGREHAVGRYRHAALVLPAEVLAATATHPAFPGRGRGRPTTACFRPMRPTMGQTCSVTATYRANTCARRKERAMTPT